MSPRLGILNNIPFTIPFEVCMSIFQHFVMNDMASNRNVQSYNQFLGLGGPNGKEGVQVRRGMVSQVLDIYSHYLINSVAQWFRALMYIVGGCWFNSSPCHFLFPRSPRTSFQQQDGFDRLGEVDLKAPIEIAFIDQFGQEECIGCFFFPLSYSLLSAFWFLIIVISLEQVSMEVGCSRNSSLRCVKRCLIWIRDYGWQMWKTNCIQICMRMRQKVSLFHHFHWLMWVKFQCRVSTVAHSLNWYRFIGCILGKAMYEGILVNVAFAGFFLAKVRPYFFSITCLFPDA